VPCPKPPGGYGPLLENLGPDELGALVPWAKPSEPYDGTVFVINTERLLPMVRSFDGEKLGQVRVLWERDGKPMEAKVTPTATEGKDPLLNKTVTYTVGLMPMLTPAEAEMVIDRTFNPFLLVYKGTERMFTMTARNFISIGKMLGGSVSSKTLGGPIMIGKIAGESLSRGLVAVLTTLGVLSIGLGVLNILPIPVLDGGHLALLIVESVRRRPLTLRQMELVQGFGLVLILGLMFLVFKNDLTRISTF
jgi:regulator of sigma E protease